MLPSRAMISRSLDTSPAIFAGSYSQIADPDTQDFELGTRARTGRCELFAFHPSFTIQENTPCLNTTALTAAMIRCSSSYHHATAHSWNRSGARNSETRSAMPRKYVIDREIARRSGGNTGGGRVNR